MYTDEEMTDQMPVDSVSLAYSGMKSDQLETVLDEFLFKRERQCS